MKTIYVSFDYLYVILKAETDIPNNIYSHTEEDLIFFVMDENATESDFHAADEKFTRDHTCCLYQKSCEYVHSQSKYHDDVHDRLERVSDDLIDILFDADFALKFKEYQL